MILESLGARRTRVDVSILYPKIVLYNNVLWFFINSKKFIRTEIYSDKNHRKYFESGKQRVKELKELLT